MKIKIDRLMIEVTRKCNMKCDHCLRGEAQNISMKNEHLENFLSQVSAIDRIGFTGGEPTLPSGIKVMRDFIDICKEKKIKVGDFWIITNAKVWRPELAGIIKDMSSLCCYNHSSIIEISQDQFHDDVPVKRQYFLDKVRKITKKLPVTVQTRAKKIKEKHVLSEGRAPITGVGYKPYTKSPGWFRYNEGQNIVYGDVIYVNCLGKIIWGCDWSYESQDKAENILCSVDGNIKKEVIHQERLANGDL